MKTPVAPAHRRLEFRHVAQVSFHPLELGSAQPAEVAPRPQQRLHLVFTRQQFMHKICADETRSPGNETLHAISLGSFPHDEKQKSDVRLALLAVPIL